jgi:hypothetical protein
MTACRHAAHRNFHPELEKRRRERWRVFRERLLSKI